MKFVIYSLAKPSQDSLKPGFANRAKSRCLHRPSDLPLQGQEGLFALVFIEELNFTDAVLGFQRDLLHSWNQEIQPVSNKLGADSLVLSHNEFVCFEVVETQDKGYVAILFVRVCKLHGFNALVEIGEF